MQDTFSPDFNAPLDATTEPAPQMSAGAAASTPSPDNPRVTTFSPSTQVESFDKPQMATETSTKSAKADQWVYDEQAKIDQQRKTAIDSAIAAETAKNDYDTIKNKTDAQAELDVATANLQRHQQDQAELDKRRADIEKDVADVKNTNISTTNYWAHQSTGDKVLAGIALALGTLGGGLSGTGRNSGADAISAAVDRDLELQKANLANKRAAIGEKRSLLADLTEKYKGDQEKAAAVIKAGVLKAASDKLAVVAARSNSAQVKARADAGAADLLERSDAALRPFHIKDQTEVTSRLKANPVPPEQLEKINKEHMRLVTGQEIAKMVESGDIEPDFMEKLKLGAGEFTGKLSTKEARFKALVDSFRKEYQLEYTGQGMSNQEREGFERMIADPRQNKEAFLSSLGTFNQRSARSIGSKLDIYENGGYSVGNIRNYLTPTLRASLGGDSDAKFLKENAPKK